jgi:membrane associated rhomboid family serine protease
MEKKRFSIDFNAPVILWMTIISLAVLIIDSVTNGIMIKFFACYRTSITDPMQYIRLFSYIFVHADVAHYVGNFMMMLAIGPMVEEKYGSRNLFWFIAVTALISGLVNVLFFPGKAVIGASGVVFMLILLASFTNIRQGKLPITVPLVAVLYLGNEIIKGIFTVDNISQLGHVLGGLCGACSGAVYHLRSLKRD